MSNNRFESVLKELKSWISTCDVLALTATPEQPWLLNMGDRAVSGRP